MIYSYQNARQECSVWLLQDGITHPIYLPRSVPMLPSLAARSKSNEERDYLAMKLNSQKKVKEYLKLIKELLKFICTVDVLPSLILCSTRMALNPPPSLRGHPDVSAPASESQGQKEAGPHVGRRRGGRRRLRDYGERKETDTGGGSRKTDGATMQRAPGISDKIHMPRREWGAVSHVERAPGCPPKAKRPSEEKSRPCRGHEAFSDMCQGWANCQHCQNELYPQAPFYIKRAIQNGVLNLFLFIKGKKRNILSFNFNLQIFSSIYKYSKCYLQQNIWRESVRV